MDELEAYLADTDIPDVDDPKYPRLVERQGEKVAGACQDGEAVLCCACVVGGGGARLLASAAGKMHGDLQKSAKDTTLEHSSLRSLL